MLCRKFELILIKIGFFTIFKSYSKIGQKSLYYSTVILANFFLIHIHVLMLCRKFELIPIKIGFFLRFLKVTPKSDFSSNLKNS